MDRIYSLFADFICDVHRGKFRLFLIFRPSTGKTSPEEKKYKKKQENNTRTYIQGICNCPESEDQFEPRQAEAGKSGPSAEAPPVQVPRVLGPGDKGPQPHRIDSKTFGQLEGFWLHVKL